MTLVSIARVFPTASDNSMRLLLDWYSNLMEIGEKSAYFVNGANSCLILDKDEKKDELINLLMIVLTDIQITLTLYTYVRPVAIFSKVCILTSYQHV